MQDETTESSNSTHAMLPGGSRAAKMIDFPNQKANRKEEIGDFRTPSVNAKL
jgi:hypothetical protein